MKFQNSLIFTVLLLSLLNCNETLKSYIKEEKNTLKVYIEPTQIDIDILFLRSISSKEVSSEKKSEMIKTVSENHARWFQTRLKTALLKDGIAVVEKDKANLILRTKIVDMGEIRAKMFIEGLSIGLVLGIIVGGATGDAEIGLAVFVWEVIEEIIILYILKSYFMVTTIELSAENKEGKLLLSKEFTAYSNDKFIEKLPEFAKGLKENKVRASFDKNASEISEFLYQLKTEP